MSHYDWLQKNLSTFFERVGVDFDQNAGIIGAHGDKGYGYRWRWEEHGIPFEHGMAIYLLTYTRPFSHEVRETGSTWVDPAQWVIDNYERFKDKLPPSN